MSKQSIARHLRAMAGCAGIAVVAIWPQVAAAEARIVEPAFDATVHDNRGDVHVVVKGVPPGDAVQPVLDGRIAPVYYPTPVFDLHGVARGTHELRVDVLGPRDEQVGQSRPIRFNVWQASRLNREHRAD